MDVISELNFDGFLAVDGEVGLVGNADDVNAHGRGGRNDDGTQREEVWTDGGDDGCRDVWHDDGTVRREVVGGRSRWCRDDDAIGAKGRNDLGVDLDGEVCHAGDGSLGDNDVVQRVPFLEQLAVAVMFGVHHLSHVDDGGVFAPGVKRGKELAEGYLGKEAERAEIDGEDRRGRAGEGSSSGQQSPISPENNDEIGLVLRQVNALY